MRDAESHTHMHSHSYTYTHTPIGKQHNCAAAAAINKFECCHDVIDGVNIWRFNTKKTATYAGSKYPAHVSQIPKRHNDLHNYSWSEFYVMNVLFLIN